MKLPLKRCLAMGLCLILALGAIRVEGTGSTESSLPTEAPSAPPEEASPPTGTSESTQPEVSVPEENTELPPTQSAEPISGDAVTPTGTEAPPSEAADAPENTEAPQPEATVHTLTARDAYTVRVTSESGFPQGVSLVVTPLSSAACEYIHWDMLGLSPWDTGIGLDLQLLKDGAPWFPEGETLTVTVEGLPGYNRASVYHLEGVHRTDVEALVQSDVALLSARSPQQVEAHPGDGSVTFYTDSFSVFYILKGTARPGEADGTVVNVLSGTNNTHYAAPGSTLIFRRTGYSPYWRFTKESSSISATVSGNSLRTSWISGQDCTLTIPADAPIGEEVILQSGRGASGQNTGTVTVIVQATDALIASILESKDYPLYLTVIADSTRIPGEPSVAEGGNWRFLQQGYTSPSTRILPFADRGKDYIPADILSYLNFTNSVDGTNTMGVADASGRRTLEALATAPIQLDYSKVLEAIWNYRQGASTTIFGDGVALSDYQRNHTLDDFLREYRAYPYVVKVQTSYSLGWHIDCCIVPISQVRVNYDLNLPAGSVFATDTVKTPSGVSVNAGEGVIIDPGNLSGLVYGQSYPIVDSQGQEYTCVFTGWYETPTGALPRYVTGETIYPQKDTTLYAGWESPQAVVYTAQAIPGEGISGTSGSGSYPYNALVEFTAQVQPGYTFTGWYDGETCISVEETYTFRMPKQDIRYEARAVKQAFRLELRKTGMASGESALFLVSWGGGSLTVCVGNGESAAISGIPAGSLVTVAEISGWSWHYGALTQFVTLEEDTVLTFENQPIPTAWRYGETRCRNRFGQ